MGTLTLSAPIDPMDPTLILLREAVAYVPVPRGKPRVSELTLWRWWRHGKCGVKLQTIGSGRHRFTTPAAVAEFLRAVARAEQSA